MKKLFSTITTLVLILMIPAVFIGYLYNSNTGKPIVKHAAGELVNGRQAITFTPGLMFILQ